MKRILLAFLLSSMTLLLSGCGYNELQSLDEQVKASWSQTLNQYERRAELVPKLVNSVNAYMVNERTVLTQVTQARAQVGSIRITAEDIQDPAAMAKFTQAQAQLSSALSRLIAVSENYPQLKSDGLFRDLMTQLEGTENRIATERGRYVQAVRQYNLAVRQFPTLITAKIFGYHTMPNYGVGKQDQITRDPDVKFDIPQTPSGAPAPSSAPSQAPSEAPSRTPAPSQTPSQIPAPAPAR